MSGFFCLGPQRTASSWLQLVLEVHPEIGLPHGVKETMFFDQRFGKGLSWYESHFKAMNPGIVLGEVAPTYFDSIEATERISKTFPCAKFVILVRDPVARTHSLYRHHLSKGRIRCSFDEALDRYPYLVTSGKYSVHCPRWEDVFGKDRFLYLRQEDIQENPQVVLDQVFDFLAVRRIELPTFGKEKINSADAPRHIWLARLFSTSSTVLRSLRFYRTVNFAKQLGLKAVFGGGRSVAPMSSACHDRLQREFQEDVDWLRNRLGWDFASWNYRNDFNFNSRR